MALMCRVYEPYTASNSDIGAVGHLEASFAATATSGPYSLGGLRYEESPVMAATAGPISRGYARMQQKKATAARRWRNKVNNFRRKIGLIRFLG
jgi:hypothetical protein